MTFFADNYAHISIKESELPNQGLRRGQVGAIHAALAHFIQSYDPAIISLPTGYGKTAVMLALAFGLKSNRVLMVTPTLALRRQAEGAFGSLQPLRRLGCLPDLAAQNFPRVEVVTKRMATQDDWEQFRPADVVVCTPHLTSPAIDGIAAPPSDLFDLVIFDEGTTPLQKHGQH